MFLLLLCLAGLWQCSPVSGIFGYRLPGMDTFRRFDNDMQFSDAQPVEWTFVADKAADPRYVGVIILKKEVVWVEVFKEVRMINAANKAVFGRIEGYEPGSTGSC
jgi:hypothetical protein